MGRLIRYGASGIDIKRPLHLSWPLYSVWWEFELFPVICVFGEYFRLQDPVIFFLFLKFIFAKICGFLPYLCLCWFSAKDLWRPMVQFRIALCRSEGEGRAHFVWFCILTFSALYLLVFKIGAQCFTYIFSNWSLLFLRSQEQCAFCILDEYTKIYPDGIPGIGQLSF